MKFLLKDKEKGRIGEVGGREMCMLSVGTSLCRGGLSISEFAILSKKSSLAKGDEGDCCAGFTL